MPTRHLPVLLALPFLLLPARADTPPGLPPAGIEAYQDYLRATQHKAFAIAPGGAWGWHAAADSPDLAEERAIEACQTSPRQKCVLYASNEQRVFDSKAWPRLWGPYAGASVADKATIGHQPGQRFPDIAYRMVQGAPGSLGKLNGKVVLVHFWGSWCSPCRREMPELASLHKTLAKQRDIAFVFLQVREPFVAASRWAAERKLELPLADSGSVGEGDAMFHLADGKSIADREIATSFPTTYVLDKRGLVIFSHVGPLHDWPQYAAFLRDAAARSGK